ncbi:DUF6460 domain-containing protein [Peteryoungia ipomoeae]|uniref:DUF6460 domain-containing protein n=1 Tax=Peteryoungia ipomoeae TaxID=1210932 RepID=A0A4S8P2X7_9HYPH|nr:DUF6460 domain-containing protein [Peteryoungia ipomoeae]THV23651.1 hypothetical protein FAA97_06580 [Peteryoungia ipomoeae]
MQALIAGMIKLALASLLAGSLLSVVGVTPRSVIESMGVTPQDLQNGILNALAWTAPRLLMGAVVILPVWFLTYILAPPRS